MGRAREFAIQLLFEKRRDGRFYVHSPNLAGLHLAGRNLDKIRADLEPIIKELLYRNADFVADKIKWFSSLEQVTRELTRPAPPREPKSEEHFLVITGRAA